MKKFAIFIDSFWVTTIISETEETAVQDYKIGHPEHKHAIVSAKEVW